MISPLSSTPAIATTGSRPNHQTTTPSIPIISTNPTAASKVTLQSADATPSPDYSAPKKIITLSTPSADAISNVMSGNIWASSSTTGLASLFKGLGEAVLGRFATTQDNFQQTVSESWSLGLASGSDINAIDLAAQAGAVENTIQLKLSTVSNKQIAIAIAFDTESQSNKLSVALSTSAELSDEESQAIAKLAQGFESTLQGIGKNLSVDSPSRFAGIDMAGLLDFDPKLLSSLELKVDASSKFAGLTSFSLQADSSRRSFAMSGIDGDLALDVDLSNPQFFGTAEQQKNSITRYLKQFDAANARAQGQENLIGQFKSAFSQLQSNYPSAESSLVRRPDAFIAARNQWLSGLADFNASMSGEFSSGAADNGKTQGKLDYQSAQQTTSVQRGNKEYVAQNESSSLNATLFKCRDGGPPSETGNYDLYQINDSSSTTTEFTLATDKYGVTLIESAHTSSLIKQMLEMRKMVNHKQEDYFSVPTENTTQQDLLQPMADSVWPALDKPV